MPKKEIDVHTDERLLTLVIIINPPIFRGTVLNIFVIESPVENAFLHFAEFSVSKFYSENLQGKGAEKISAGHPIY